MLLVLCSIGRMFYYKHDSKNTANHAHVQNLSNCRHPQVCIHTVRLAGTCILGYITYQWTTWMHRRHHKSDANGTNLPTTCSVAWLKMAGMAVKGTLWRSVTYVVMTSCSSYCYCKPHLTKKTWIMALDVLTHLLLIVYGHYIVHIQVFPFK